MFKSYNTWWEWCTGPVHCCVWLLHENNVSGGYWGESRDSLVFPQNTTIFIVYAALVIFKCFVHLWHEFDVSSLSRQGSSVIFDAKLDCLAWLIEQKHLSCSEKLHVCSRWGLGEVWAQILCRRWLWGESHNSPKIPQITPKLSHSAPRVLRRLHFNFCQVWGTFGWIAQFTFWCLELTKFFFVACPSPICDFLKCFEF